MLESVSCGLNGTAVRFFDNLPSGIIICKDNFDKDIIYFNAETLRLFDCDTENEFLDLCRASFKALIFSEDSAFSIKNIEEQLKKNENGISRIFFRAETKKGNLISIDCRLRAACDPDEGRLLFCTITASSFDTDSPFRQPTAPPPSHFSLFSSGKSDAADIHGGYDINLQKDASLKKYIVENIDSAILKGCISAYFQPIIRTLTGEVYGLEALSRWNDPVFGFISPEKFIPVLEEYHLIHKLDIYMIRTVISAIRKGKYRSNVITPVSFNLSGYDFMLCDPFEIIEDAMGSDTWIRPFLRIEITESALVYDENKFREIINKFRTGGYEIWIDNFGSGYSSINIFKNFDFDTLKIDILSFKTFDDRIKTLLTSTVLTAKSLGIHTLALGVETNEQYDFLKSIGCEKMQGRRFGMPEPLDNLTASFEEKNISAEPNELIPFYDEAGLTDIISDYPSALYLDDGGILSPLYVSESFAHIIPGEYFDNVDITALLPNDKALLNLKSPNNLFKAITYFIKPITLRRILTLFTRVRDVKKEQSISIVVGDICYQYSLKPVAFYNEKIVYLARIKEFSRCSKNRRFGIIPIYDDIKNKELV